MVPFKHIYSATMSAARITSVSREIACYKYNLKDEEVAKIILSMLNASSSVGIFIAQSSDSLYKLILSCISSSSKTNNNDQT